MLRYDPYSFCNTMHYLLLIVPAALNSSGNPAEWPCFAFRMSSEFSADYRRLAQPAFRKPRKPQIPSLLYKESSSIIWKIPLCTRGRTAGPSIWPSQQYRLSRQLRNLDIVSCRKMSNFARSCYLFCTPVHNTKMDLINTFLCTVVS